MHTYQAVLESLADRPDEPCQDFTDGHALTSRSTHEVLARARDRGASLAAVGLVQGDRVGIMVSDPAEFLPLVHGCLLYGLVAVPLYPPPLFGKVESYRATLEAILASAGARVLLVSDGSAGLIEVPVERIVELGALPGAGSAPPSVSPDDLAFLQFTSGSAGTPKGVRITHRALVENAHAIMVDGLNADGRDRGVSWLPLYHDMGLVGFGLAPLVTNTKVTFIPTARFVRNPAVWLRTIDAFRATITFAPNFAYGLVAKRVDPAGLDLRSVRMWGCGAEPISPRTLEAFERRFSECGVAPGQVSPCYGLAEATLAVTFTPPSAGRIVDEIDARDFEERGLAGPPRGERSLSYVSCGMALPRHEVLVVDNSGAPLPERTAGEIVVESPSLGAGYFAEPEESARVFREGRLFTGDVGYLADGQLFVTGRIKDTVIVNGRNYDPHSIEAVARLVDGVRLAAAVNYAGAFGDELAVLVERRGTDDRAITEGVRARIAAELGLEANVVCLPPGGLPRTTSGKLKRSAARALCPPRTGDS